MKILERIFPAEDRVRRSTPGTSQQRIDRAIDAHIRHYAGRPKEAITARIDALEREWDIERFLEMNASLLALSGVALGALVSRRWLFLSGTVLAFLLQHALQGWCPPVPAFRRFGVRTRQEIDRERHALKTLRGDYDAIRPRSD